MKFFFTTSSHYRDLNQKSLLPMNFKKSVLSKAPVLIALLLILTSCGFLLVPLKKEVSRNFSLRAANFEDALNLSIKAARDIGYDITRINRKGGNFKASKGFGIDEITILNFNLKKGYKKKLYFTIRIKSSKDPIVIINELTSSIDNYLDILPIAKEDISL